MGELTDIRHVQLVRLLGLPRDSTPLAIENAARALPGRLAEGLFGEAADSDDVASSEAALSYLEDRLRVFQELLGDDVAGEVRQAFVRQLRAWDEDL